MDSWWQLGEGIGYSGSTLAVYQIECAFCGERGNFSTEHHAQKSKANGHKVLNFDTLKCGNCAGYVLVLWSPSDYGGALHDYRVLPWPLGTGDGSVNWPQSVTRFWRQAHDGLKGENYDAAVVMARSALQAVTRQQGAVRGSLQSEIDDLASRGLLPISLKNWAHELRALGNNSAHPDDDSDEVDPEDARDIVQFLDFLLEYAYDVPKKIEVFRQRHTSQNSPSQSTQEGENHDR